jgi:hypothetical protein
MTGRVEEVNAAPAVIGIDLTGILLAWIGPVGHVALLHAGEDRIKRFVTDQERIMLAEELDARLPVVQGYSIIDIDCEEKTGGLRIGQTKQTGEEVRRLVFVARKNEEVIELNGQLIVPFKDTAPPCHRRDCWVARDAA